MNITNLELTQATIEIFCGFICLMLAVIILMNGGVRNSWKLLKWMFFSTALLFFSEAVAYIFRGNTDGLSRFMTGAGNFVVFLLNLVLISLFMRYMYDLLKEKGVTPSKIYIRIVSACMVLNLFILVSNLFTKWMYYFDEVNYYHRDTGWYVYTILNIVCVLTASAMSMRELRKDNYSNIAEKYFKLGNNLNQRDAIAVRKLISGFIKLIYPDGEVSKEEVREIMEISLELRRRVKEQLKKLGGMEFYDVNFSYIDNDSFDEHFVSVPEQGGGKLISEGMGKAGCLYTVSKSKTGMIGCYRLETQMMPGKGNLTCTGIGSGKEPKEATNTAFNYLKANGNAISGSISTTTKDYIINYQDMQGLGMTGRLALPTLIAISSAA